MQSRFALTLAFFALGLLTCETSGAAARGAGPAARGGARSAPEASACPAQLAPNPLSSRPGSTLVLVPAGATSLLLCSYHGLNPPSQSGELERARAITGATELGRLTHEFDVLREASRSLLCPMDGEVGDPGDVRPRGRARRRTPYASGSPGAGLRHERARDAHRRSPARPGTGRAAHRVRRVAAPPAKTALRDGTTHASHRTECLATGRGASALEVSRYSLDRRTPTPRARSLRCRPRCGGRVTRC